MKRVIIVVLMAVVCMFTVAKVEAEEKFFIDPVTYTITVDYNISIVDLARDFEIDHTVAETDIKDSNFVLFKMDKKELKFKAVLIHLKHEARISELRDYMKNKKLYPADIKQLLVFGKQNPDEWRKYDIVALGSVWTDPVACLYSGIKRSRLFLGYAFIGLLWDEHYSFLAIQK